MLSQSDVLKRIAGLAREDLEFWVGQGWVMPARHADAYVYREIDVARVRLIFELRTELSINDEALPSVLSLVDQVYGLRQELRVLARAVGAEHEDGRQRIATQVAHLRNKHTPDGGR